MLTLQQCRTLLAGDGDHLTDSDLESLRSGLYGIARLIARAYAARTVFSPQTTMSLLTTDEREQAQERAAILEFDAGLARTTAEQLAVTQVFEARRTRSMDSEIA